MKLAWTMSLNKVVDRLENTYRNLQNKNFQREFGCEFIIAPFGKALEIGAKNKKLYRNSAKEKSPTASLPVRAFGTYIPRLSTITKTEDRALRVFWERYLALLFAGFETIEP